MAVTSVRYWADEWGVGELWVDGERVVHHGLPRPPRSQADRAATFEPERLEGPNRPNRPNRPQGTARLPEGSVPRRLAPDRDDFATALVRRLRRFFAGQAVDFAHVELDLEGLTGFSHALADALCAVPRGEVVTYGELAALAGRPGAARAAGTFCAQNRLAVFIPCHRVVGAGGIGGYGSLGVEYKRRLLALEDVVL